MDRDTGMTVKLIKPGSHVTGKVPDVKFSDNLVGWTLANAGDATLAWASYYEPGLT